jgi:uncharacterized membrane protein
MIEVTASVSIHRSADDVFAFLADMENNPRWQQGMRSCAWTSEPPLRLGSTYDQEASFLGKKITSSFEVVEFAPGERIRIRTTGGSMPIDVTRTVTGRPAGTCTVGAVVRGDSSKLFKIADPLMKRMVERSVRGDYRRLKKLLESE